MEGLERRGGPPKRVIVIGAGMVGLVAAYELARAGHDPLILEGQSASLAVRHGVPRLVAEDEPE